MALFRRKKPDEPTGGGGGNGGGGAAGGGAFEPDPEKARKWFEHARTYADTFNFDGALLCFANGIKFDPDAMSAHETMYEVAIKYMNRGGKGASGKEVKGIEDSSAVSRFAAAEFAWMKDIANPSLALKTLEAAIKANQREFGNVFAPRILGAMRRSKKVSKGTLIQAKDLFKEVHAWNEALAAGQLALQIDPTDNALDHELKDISAQRAMDAGGYEQAAGKEGGYRTFVKDAEKQRELQELESIAGGASVEERNLIRAREAFEKNPNVPDIINQYAQLVKKAGTPEAEKLAHEIYMKGFERTGEYRFRMAAGDIKIDQLRREVNRLEAKHDETPADVQTKNQLENARHRFLELESSEYGERVAKYPTDRNLKLRVGEIEFNRGNLEDAMAALQAAKDEPKLRVRAGHMLGKCFAAEGWHMEAISEFKEALGAVEPGDKDRELMIRYDLMASLIEQARKERDVGLAREALEICSGIVRKDATYRDIRARRREVEELIKELTGG